MRKERVTGKTADWKEGVREDLKDLAFAKEFINASFNEGPEIFLAAIELVLEVHKGKEEDED